MKQAGIGDQAHGGLPGGFDDVLVLGNALADLAGRDEQQAVDTAKGFGQCLGTRVVGHAERDASRAQILSRSTLQRADTRHDGVGRHPLQQGFDHQPAELAGGTGHEETRLGCAHDGGPTRFPCGTRYLIETA